MIGVVAEPIQSEGGDFHGSPRFFQHLQIITKKVRTNAGITNRFLLNESSF